MGQQPIEWEEVTDSSCVSAMAYDEKTSTLLIRYNNGREYAYEGVPAASVRSLRTSPSIGQSLSDWVKPHYPTTRRK